MNVNIGQAKARLSELVAASVRGEEVVLQRDGIPQAWIVPIDAARSDALAKIAADRAEAFGMFSQAYEGYNIDLASMKRDRIDYDEKFRLSLGPDC